MSKGGSAKGELVLAIFELGNCFRHGWGVEKDPVAAREYYETAANLGDTDAMNEVAWCYLEGFGCRKDKVRSFHSFSFIRCPLFARLDFSKGKKRKEKRKKKRLDEKEEEGCSRKKDQKGERKKERGDGWREEGGINRYILLPLTYIPTFIHTYITQTPFLPAFPFTISLPFPFLPSSMAATYAMLMPCSCHAPQLTLSIYLSKMQVTN